MSEPQRWEDDWSTWTTDELQAEFDILQEEVASIRGQIDTAKAKAVGGEYSDPDWFARVQGAARWKGAESQRLARFLKARKVEDRKRAHNNHQVYLESKRERSDWFQIIAKRELPPETYERIRNMAFDAFDAAIRRADDIAAGEGMPR